MADVLAIVGPTASGKTALSIRLAKRFGGEIINGDSMQVYRGLDIGTAKITKEEMSGVPHHLLDICEPDESFSVADYQRLVREKIAEIRSRGSLPIIVGGTGLYVQAVLYDFRFTEKKADESLRQSLAEELEQYGPVHMHNKLLRLDSGAAIHPNNTRRVLRALEVLLSGGRKGDTEKGAVPVYDAAIIGLDLPREILYDRINLRVDRMLEKGLIAEVESLLAKGVRDTQAMKAIGYKEIVAYLDGKLPLEEAVEKLKKNSRNYAKRQFTYFRNKLPVFWVDALQPAELMDVRIEQFLQEKGTFGRIERREAENSNEHIEGDH